MKNAYMVTIDTFIISVATFFGVVLRDNFVLSLHRIINISPFLFATAIASAILIPIFGANRLIWRFSALPDYLRLAAMMAAISVCSVAITFGFNRLDSVPRSLPFIQFNLSLMFLVGLRVLYRLHHATRRARQMSMTPLRIVEQPATETVLLVGLSRLTEAYLESAADFARGRIKIAGILGHRKRHVGRLVAGHQILGIPEEISRVVADLSVKGIQIEKLVVAAPFSSISIKARDAIAAIERSRSIETIFLSEKLGLEAISKGPSLRGSVCRPPRSECSPAFEIQMSELEALRGRRYWRIKRAVDVVAALSLLILTSPLMVFAALCVFASIGRPSVFWQQRPGLGGRPFRLLKFRTMRAAFSADGCPLSDQERISTIGKFLRRTRLDELPQLFNIVRGDMSFVGPRPLLPRDQEDAYRARLLVRPGLTGWAQIVGGRTISSEDKAALDVWYVRNASLSLDLKIALKTIPIVLFGETISWNLIENAWRELHEAGVLQAGFRKMDAERERAAA